MDCFDPSTPSVREKKPGSFGSERKMSECWLRKSQSAVVPHFGPPTMMKFGSGIRTGAISDNFVGLYYA